MLLTSALNILLCSLVRKDIKKDGNKIEKNKTEKLDSKLSQKSKLEKFVSKACRFALKSFESETKSKFKVRFVQSSTYVTLSLQSVRKAW